MTAPPTAGPRVPPRHEAATSKDSGERQAGKEQAGKADGHSSNQPSAGEESGRGTAQREGPYGNHNNARQRGLDLNTARLARVASS